jgi:hypothetical protein
MECRPEWGGRANGNGDGSRGVKGNGMEDGKEEGGHE